MPVGQAGRALAHSMAGFRNDAHGCGRSGRTFMSDEYKTAIRKETGAGAGLLPGERGEHRRAVQRGAVVQDHAHRDAFQQRAHATLGEKGL